MSRTSEFRVGVVLRLALALAVLVSGCTGGAPGPAPTSRDETVTVDGVTATAQPVVVVPPVVEHTELAGGVYELLPSGPLQTSASLHFRLPEPVAPELGVAIVTSETREGPWVYLPATLDQTRTIVTAEVSHFSFFGVVQVAAQEISSIFKKQFMDALSGGLLRDVQPASCGGDPATNSYGASSRKTDILTWCLGYEDGRNILRITNTRRYPLQLAHPKLDVIDKARLLDSWWKAGTLSRSISGSYSILGAGETITYGASLRPGQRTTVTTEMDGLGLAMTALQVGVETALLFMASPAGSAVPDTKLAKATVSVMDTLSHSSKCGGAVTSFAKALANEQDANVGAFLVDCLAAAGSTIPMFGLIAAVSTIGGLIAFFAGQASAFRDLVLGRDKVTVLIGRAESPDPQAASNKPNVGKMPNGFQLPSIYDTPSLAALDMCWSATKPKYSGLARRVSSRLGSWVSETYESGGSAGAIALVSADDAVALMTQINARVGWCVKNPWTRYDVKTVTQPITVKGGWDEATADVTETFMRDGSPNVGSYGSVTVVARKGRFIVAVNYWTMYDKPISDGVNQDAYVNPTKEVGKLLKRLGG